MDVGVPILKSTALELSSVEEISRAIQTHGKRRRFGFVENATFYDLGRMQPVQKELYSLREAIDFCDTESREWAGVVVDARGLDDVRINNGMVLCAFVPRRAGQRMEWARPSSDRPWLSARFWQNRASRVFDLPGVFVSFEAAPPNELARLFQQQKESSSAQPKPPANWAGQAAARLVAKDV